MSTVKIVIGPAVPVLLLRFTSPAVGSAVIVIVSGLGVAAVTFNGTVTTIAAEAPKITPACVQTSCGGAASEQVKPVVPGLKAAALNVMFAGRLPFTTT